MKKHFRLAALLIGAVFMLGLVSCNNDPEPKEKPVKGFELKTGGEINDIFRNEEKLNAKLATTFAKATAAPAGPAFYLDIAEKDVPVWYDEANTTIYYYVAPGNKLILNADSAKMFVGTNEEQSKFTSINTSDFYTGNVTTMESMFCYCPELTSIDVSKFNTSNVTSFRSMFYGCSSLKNVDVSHFDTSKAESMRTMFCDCKLLEKVDVSKFDTSKVTNFGSMFYCCCSLKTLDVSNFDTSEATNMVYMFYRCSRLKNIDVSTFNISAVTDMSYMFNGCEELSVISVSPDTDWASSSVLTDSTLMFYGCTKLTGGNGTVLDDTKLDKTYARVDSADAPGYFTVKK